MKLKKTHATSTGKNDNTSIMLRYFRKIEAFFSLRRHFHTSLNFFIILNIVEVGFSNILANFN